MATPALSKYIAFRKFRCHGHDYNVGDRLQKRHLTLQLARKLLEQGKICDGSDDLGDDRRQKYLRDVASK